MTADNLLSICELIWVGLCIYVTMRWKQWEKATLPKWKQKLIACLVIVLFFAPIGYLLLPPAIHDLVYHTHWMRHVTWDRGYPD